MIAGIDLSGKTAIVTGGYSGIGIETVRALASAGAKVVVPARRPAAAKDALEAVAGDIEVAAMDLGDISSVRAFAADFVASGQTLDILINNAGIMACPETRVGPGWESQFGVNHLGHMALYQGLEPTLLKSGDARVVALSSTAHIRGDVLWDDPHFNNTPYEKWTAYAQAKTANAQFAMGVDAFMHISHEFVKVNAGFATDRRMLKKHIHQHGFAASNAAVNVEPAHRLLLLAHQATKPGPRSFNCRIQVSQNALEMRKGLDLRWTMLDLSARHMVQIGPHKHSFSLHTPHSSLAVVCGDS